MANLFNTKKNQEHVAVLGFNVIKLITCQVKESINDYKAKHEPKHEDVFNSWLQAQYKKGR